MKFVEETAIVDWENGTYNAHDNLETYCLCDPLSWSISAEGAGIDQGGQVTFGEKGEWAGITAAHNPRDSMTLAILKVRILYKSTTDDDLRDVTGQIVELQAGELVTITQEIGPLEFAPGTWSVEGNRVSDYITTRNYGTVVPFGVGLENMASQSFYWYKEGTYTVSLSIKTLGDQTLTKTATFVVTKPPAPISVSTDEFRLTAQGTAQILRFGHNPPARPTGIRLEGPTYESAESGWFQFIEYDYEKSVNPTFTTVRYGAVPVYDGPLVPYGLVGPLLEDSPSCGASIQPSIPKISTTEFEMNLSFSSYFVFRSKKPKSIWVPIKRALWFANGAASLVNGVWTITTNKHSTAETITFEFVDDLRQWNGYRPAKL